MGQNTSFFLVIMASRVFHLSGLQLDQATSGAYYNIIIRGSGFVRDTGVQGVSGQKFFYDTITFYSGLNLTGDFVPSGEIAGNLIPKTNNLYDVGSISKQWKNMYCDGTGWFDTLIVDENLSVATGLSVGGSTAISGNLSVGLNGSIQGNLGISGALDVTGDVRAANNVGITGNLTVTGDFLPKNISTNFLPKTNNLYDLGSLSQKFKNAYFDGFVQADDLSVSYGATIGENLIVSGNITGLGNSDIIGDLTVNRLFLSGTGIPTGTGAPGSFGQFAIGSGHLYICTGTNIWARTHLTGWT